MVARLGSFSSAARELDVAPSVVTKRITQLEERVHTRLIVRSTRGLTLTPAGERLLPRFLRVVAELDELLLDTPSTAGEIDGHVRIKGPTTITSLYLGALLSEFQVNNPRVTLEVVLMDRTVNPLEENFDLVVGARAASFPNVVDIPLCTYPQALCCAPAYLGTKPEPRHPGDLVDHDCLTTVLFGTTWPFESPRGGVSVEVRSRFHANDGRVILDLDVAKDSVGEQTDVEVTLVQMGGAQAAQRFQHTLVGRVPSRVGGRGLGRAVGDHNSPCDEGE